MHNNIVDVSSFIICGLKMRYWPFLSLFFFLQYNEVLGRGACKIVYVSGTYLTFLYSLISF